MVTLAEPFLQPGNLGLWIETDAHSGLGNQELLLLLSPVGSWLLLLLLLLLVREMVVVLRWLQAEAGVAAHAVLIGGARW